MPWKGPFSSPCATKVQLSCKIYKSEDWCLSSSIILEKKTEFMDFSKPKTCILMLKALHQKNLLTDTNKSVRFEARRAYKSIFEELYKEGFIKSYHLMMLNKIIEENSSFSTLVLYICITNYQ